MKDAFPPEQPRPERPPSAAPVPERIGLGRFLLAAARCVRFYSRLPMPALPGEADPHAAPDFTVEPIGLPLAALVIALPAAVVAAIGALLKLDALLVAALVVATLVVSTGAFHEDGLGDSADGLFGGHDVERRLEIMKDSRIGVFAGCAIMLSLMLRATALAALLKSGGLDAMLGAILIGAIVSRVEGVRLLATLPTARAYGASATVGRPSIRVACFAAGLALCLAAIIAAACGLPFSGVLAGLAVSGILVSLLGHMARRLIGGQTGDIAGAGQQLSEIGLYLGLAAALAA
jgi:adenosylcobinamide-GDP ribazoletransferase